MACSSCFCFCFSFFPSLLYLFVLFRHHESTLLRERFLLECMTRAELANLTRAFSSTHNLTPKLLTAIIDEYCKKKNKTASVTAEVRSSVPCIAILLNRAVHMNQEKLVERLFRIFKAASTRKYKHTTLLAILHAMTLIKDAELGERVVLRITDILEGPFTLRESSYLFAKLSIVMPGHAVQLRLLDVIRKKLAIPQRVKPLLIEMFLEKKGVQGIAEWRFGPKGGAPPPTPIAPRTPDVPDPTALLEDALQKHSAHDIADLTVLAEGLQNGTTGFDRRDMADVAPQTLCTLFPHPINCMLHSPMYSSPKDPQHPSLMPFHQPPLKKKPTI